MEISEPIDAVITWVDGSDKIHAEKLANYCLKHGIDRSTEAASPTRFNDRGEIYYCVKSLLRFAPWLRTIFIVTDQQRPSIFDDLQGTKEAEKLKLIDHREIFAGYENYLPTFNSLSIETLLWRIEDLATNFIYLNDDFALLQPVFPEDFFRKNKLVLRGNWKVIYEKKWRNYWKKLNPFSAKKNKKPQPQNAHRTVQEISAKLAGFNKHFFHLPHAPLPLKKSTFEEYFAAQPQLLTENISYPLRNPKQFWPMSLAQHLEIQKKNVYFDNSLKAISVNGACQSLHKIKSRLAKADKNTNIPFICLQSIDEAEESTQRFLLEWLEGKINK